MTERICHGLPADWLNAWLAAVGATVLNDGIRLRWTTDTIPVAVLSADGDDDPVDVLAASWPDNDRLRAMPISYEWSGLNRMGRKVFVDVFAERARAARSSADSWTLSSTMTDLHVYKSGEVAHGPLDPPGPGPIKWLHHRLLKTLAHVDAPAAQMTATVEGRGSRVVDNGLGFDLTRVTTQADSSQKTVNPVVEALAFFGLALLPIRGDGIDQRTGRIRSRTSVRQRGWQSTPHRYFEWPAWRQSLDMAAIDALLDQWHRSRRTVRGGHADVDRPAYDREAWNRLGVHAAWRTVGYESRSSADPTVGYGSERL